jgi:5-hydroxyisourate hydrolase-like protein (transthyretin family)
VPAHQTTLTLETARDGRIEHVCICCYWRGTPSKGEINTDYIFNSIAKLNRSNRRIQKDAVLHAVGIHIGLLKKKKNQRLPIILSQEERDRVLYFLRQFLAQQKLEVKIKD